MPKPVKNRLHKLPIPPKPKRPSDPSRAAHAILAEHLARVQASDQPILDPETVISEHMRKIGARGGKVSGAKRMEMPKKERVAIAKKAAAGRWKKS